MQQNVDIRDLVGTHVNLQFDAQSGAPTRRVVCVDPINLRRPFAYTHDEVDAACLWALLSAVEAASTRFQSDEPSKFAVEISAAALRDPMVAPALQAACVAGGSSPEAWTLVANEHVLTALGGTAQRRLLTAKAFGFEIALRVSPVTAIPMGTEARALFSQIWASYGAVMEADEDPGVGLWQRLMAADRANASLCITDTPTIAPIDFKRLPPARTLQPRRQPAIALWKQ
ncbi:MAG TPA: hypothetical protein DCZ49_08945 [Hyphomonadaceae bacterium]|jgi:hypothetical protein|nr:hypothetical protein [Hyphomonadaceae bacterium]